jgi:hypothetical protein
MGDGVKSFCWTANDFADGEGKIEQLAIRVKTEEDAQSFKAAFEAGKLFNKKAKDGDEDLVWADVIEDEAEEKEDDIEVNHQADEGN